MANNIFFERYTNIRDIKKQWLQLDKVADSINDEYIKYTYYQSYEWNEFLYDHLTKGLSGLTTTMCYDLVTVSGKPFGIIPLTVTRLSKKARIPSCRVAGVLNMVCPYVEDFGEDIVAAVADHIKRTYKGMKLSLADVPCCSPLVWCATMCRSAQVIMCRFRYLPRMMSMCRRYQRTSTKTYARLTIILRLMASRCN